MFKGSEKVLELYSSAEQKTELESSELGHSAREIPKQSVDVTWFLLEIFERRTSR